MWIMNWIVAGFHFIKILFKLKIIDKAEMPNICWFELLKCEDFFALLVWEKNKQKHNMKTSDWLIIGLANI